MSQFSRIVVAALLVLPSAFSRPANAQTLKNVMDPPYNAKCDWNGTTGTDDTTAIQSALNAEHNVLIPRNCLVSSLTFGNVAYASIWGLNPNTHPSNIATNSSLLVSNSTNAPAIAVNANIPGLAIRNLGITAANVTTTSGGDGIHMKGYGDLVLDNIEVQQRYVGLNLADAGEGAIRNSNIHNNRSDGVLCNGSNMNSTGTCQWTISDTHITGNGAGGSGWAFNVQSPAGTGRPPWCPATGPCASQITMGTLENVKTNSNASGGVNIQGTATVPVQGVRVIGGFYGADGYAAVGNPEFRFDSFNSTNGPHQITGAFIEEAGPTSSMNATPCVVITSNNTGKLTLTGNVITGCGFAGGTGISNASSALVKVTGGLIGVNATGISNSGTLEATGVDLSNNTTAAVTNTGTYVGLMNEPLSANNYSASAAGFLFGSTAKLLFGATGPSITSGFCTSPSVSSANGTASFQITIGSGCAASTGVLSLPSAAGGWTCDFHDITNPNGNKPDLTASFTSSVTVTNYSRISGAPTNWTDGDVIAASCTAH